jgi:carbon-monoxide dehydrogenase large subunit
MQMPQMRHADPSATTFCDGGAYHEVLERCLSAFDWAGRTARIGRDADGRWRGIGLGCFVEGGAAGPREGARITAEADGTVTVAVGSSALGQGLETVLSQIAADALALPMARIRLRHGSTDLVRDGFGSFHSRSTVMGGNAVALAAAAFLETLRAEAARRLGCTAAEVAWADGRLSAGGRALDLADFAALSEERSFANSKHTYSYGAHAVEVAVRAETGQVEILDYVTTEDVGRVVNPATLEGQVVGAVVQGLGSVFLEELKYDDQGQLLTGSFADYFLPTATCVPRIRSIPLGLVPSPNNPLGLKGAGEGGLIATGGAVANAIACALRPLGVAPNHLPLTPPRLWALIEEAAREAGRA